jgi:hypothetical protein
MVAYHAIVAIDVCLVPELALSLQKEGPNCDHVLQ